MGAFDGVRISGISAPLMEDGSLYISAQPAFNFTREFTVADLANRIDEAKRAGLDHVYVKPEVRRFSGARLDLWYAEALVQRLDNVSRAT